jgi:hypothetical protein
MLNDNEEQNFLLLVLFVYLQITYPGLACSNTFVQGVGVGVGPLGE